MSNTTNDGRIAEAHDPKYGVHIMVWVTLIALTVITVAVAGMDLGNFTLPVALFIAAMKSTLVVNIFMHIKVDDVLFKIFFLFVIAVLLVVFVLMGFDIFFRGS